MNNFIDNQNEKIICLVTQCPDMTFHRFIRAIKAEDELVLYGSSEQTCDFNFIDVFASANLAAAAAPQALGGSTI